MTHPPIVPPPDVKFERLPAPTFSSASSSTTGMKFALVNVEGKPPEATFAARVYFMPKKLPSLLSTQRARELAVKMGFTDPPVEKSPTEFHFVSPADTLRTIDLDITTLNFRYKYAFENRADIFTRENLLSKDQALSQVREFILQYNLFDSSLLNGDIETHYVTYDPGPGIFRPSESIAQATAVRIDYRRKPIGDFPIVSPVFFKSYNYALFTNNPQIKIADLSYTYWPIAFDNYGTYPLKSSDAAWQDLIDGYALVVSLGNNNPENIIIRKIYLAYYDSEEPHMYLQPIFVFEGDNDFVAYLPAILPQWLE